MSGTFAELTKVSIEDRIIGICISLIPNIINRSVDIARLMLNTPSQLKGIAKFIVSNNEEYEESDCHHKFLQHQDHAALEFQNRYKITSQTKDHRLHSEKTILALCPFASLKTQSARSHHQ